MKLTGKELAIAYTACREMRWKMLSISDKKKTEKSYADFYREEADKYNKLASKFLKSMKTKK